MGADSLLIDAGTVGQQGPSPGSLTSYFAGTFLFSLRVAGRCIAYSFRGAGVRRGRFRHLSESKLWLKKKGVIHCEGLRKRFTQRLQGCKADKDTPDSAMNPL